MSNISSEKKPSYEIYTLILRHSIFDGEHEYEIEEPIVLKQMAEISLGHSEWAIDCMMDRMKHELINRYTR